MIGRVVVVWLGLVGLVALLLVGYAWLVLAQLELREDIRHLRLIVSQLQQAVATSMVGSSPRPSR